MAGELKKSVERRTANSPSLLITDIQNISKDFWEKVA